MRRLASLRLAKRARMFYNGGVVRSYLLAFRKGALFRYRAPFWFLCYFFVTFHCHDFFV